MKKKILSLLTAFAMVFGIIAAPFTSASAAEEKTETVTLHKILQTKTNLDDSKFPGTKGLDDTEYDGNAIQNIASYFGDGSIEIDGVYFALKFADDYGTTDEEKAMAGKYVKADAADKLKPASPLTATEDVKEAVGGLTQANNAGVVFKTADLKGKFEIDEIHDMSTYVGTDGETLTDMKAVPVKITLPLVNDKGTVTNAHVYPKNIEEKPDTNKDFTKEFENGKNGRTDQEKADAEAEKHNVGDVIDYTVTTKVPAKTKWKTAFWDDKMTEGLTYITKAAATGDLAEKGISIKYDGAEMNANWYTLEETQNGFTLKLTETGLAEIAKATEDKIIRLDYHAVLNEKAVVSIPESNDVTFHYGNNEDHGNTPVPNKPNENGELTITKTWDTGATKQGVTFTLYNAQTGKIVEANDVEKVDGYEFENPVTIESGETMEYTWKGLNKNIEYKVEETYLDGHSVEYGKTDTAGGLTAKNYKDNNPKPINPNEPKVVTYGAKFVKTDTEGKRLQGAEFVVKNEAGKFLTGTAADRAAYNTAQEAFLEAVQAYNTAVETKAIGTDNTVTIGGVAYDNDADAKVAIKKLEKARDDAWNATLKDMNGFTADDDEAPNILKLTSNAEGQFEIAGLAPGTYNLVEITPPEGYANNKNEFEFTIDSDGKQTNLKIDFGVKDDTVADNAQQVINKKVTIPETGGIGSLIFIVAGLAIMAGAFVAYKKSQATA